MLVEVEAHARRGLGSCPVARGKARSRPPKTNVQNPGTKANTKNSNPSCFIYHRIVIYGGSREEFMCGERCVCGESTENEGE